MTKYQLNTGVFILSVISLYKLLDRKMASVAADKLSKEDHDELCCSYAALMLHDDGLEITVSLFHLFKDCFVSL